METKFQTSFIPKKPLPGDPNLKHTPATSSILMLIAVILFVASLGGAGFTFLAKGYLEKVQEDSRKNLADNEKRFNLPLIEELKKANTKIDLAKQLIQNHIAVSEALNIIANLTAEKVYFTSFQFLAGDAKATTYRIKMAGVADSFNSIAFQSDVFGKSSKYGTNKVIKNPILSDLSVSDAGDVKFNFTGDIGVDDISYDKVFGETLDQEAGAEAPAPTN
jgi:hypothetical protein